MAERRTKVALVGCGARGRSHLDVILALRERLELVAICDRDRGTLARVGVLAGPGVHCTTELDDVARRARPDFAVVAVKSDVQPETCLALLEAGVPVLTEVPPAFAGPRARPMLEAARRRGLAFAAAENYVCTPLEELKRRAIAAGVFGTVTCAEVHGSINHKGHEIAVARAYVGFEQRPLRVTARADGRGQRGLEGVAIPAVMSGRVELESGARLELLLSGWGVGGTVPIVGWQSDFSGTRGGHHERSFHLGSGRFGESNAPLALDVRTHEVAGTPTLTELALASEPRVLWRNPFADLAFSADHRFHGMHAIEDLPQAWEIALANLLVDMAGAVRDGRPPVYPAERALEDVRIRLALLESARRGGALLEWQEEPWPIEARIAGFQPYRELRKLRRRLSRLLARRG